MQTLIENGRLFIYNETTGEFEKPIYNDKLYGVYPIISNKSIRKNEKKYIFWKNKSEDVPGKMMVLTNRGFFLDGYQIDEKSIDAWFNATKNNRNWRPRKK